MLNVFLTVILPTFLVAAAGLALQRWRNLPVATLSQVTFYVLSPALIFDALVGQEVAGGTALRVAAAAVLATVASTGLGLAVSAALRHPRALQSAFLLSTAFPNTGNMGLPIVLLAFGEVGLGVAALVLVTQSAVGWSFGIYLAARSRSAGWTPVVQIFRVPVLYAMGVAFLVMATGWTLPPAISTPIEMLAGAALPGMLLVLGFQLGSGLEIRRWPSLIAAVLLRLVASAPIAYGLAWAVGLGGIERQVVIVSLSMPTAVFTTILASEFGAHARFVTSVVVASTIASLLTLTVVVSAVRDHLA